MPSDRDDLLTHVKGVEREYGAARLAMDRLIQIVQRDSTQLAHEVKARDVQTASDRLEATYLIRLFAAFEAALRDFWRATRKDDPPSRMRDVIDSVGARQRVPSDCIAAAHQVRDYRNRLVHPGANAVSAVALASARSSLCRFLSFLPAKW